MQLNQDKDDATFKIAEKHGGIEEMREKVKEGMINKLKNEHAEQRGKLEEKKKLKDLDVLILTALRKEKHISHFCLNEALALIEELKPKKTYLTHISHYLGKHSDVSKELPKNVELGYDGLTIEVI